jgi:hypothetical protein
VREQRFRLAGSVCYLPGPAVVGEGLAGRPVRATSSRPVVVRPDVASAHAGNPAASRGQLAPKPASAEAARALPLVNPALKVCKGMRDFPPNARSHQNAHHYGAPSWPCVHRACYRTERRVRAGAFNLNYDHLPNRLMCGLAGPGSCADGRTCLYARPTPLPARGRGRTPSPASALPPSTPALHLADYRLRLGVW